MNVRSGLIAVNAGLLLVLVALIVWPLPAQEEPSPMALPQPPKRELEKEEARRTSVPNIPRALFSSPSKLSVKDVTSSEKESIPPPAPLRLLGIIKAGETSIAVVESHGPKLIRRLKIGDVMNGRTLTAIGRRSIDLRGPDRVEKLMLDPR